MSGARLRGLGIANYNFSLFRKTPLTERFNPEFRAEVFNLLNRVQFAQPNAGATGFITPGSTSQG